MTAVVVMMYVFLIRDSFHNEMLNVLIFAVVVYRRETDGDRVVSIIHNTYLILIASTVIFGVAHLYCT